MKQLAILLICLSVAYSFSPTLLYLASKTKQVIVKEDDQDQDGTKWDAIKFEYGDSEELEDNQEANEDDIDEQQEDIDEGADEQQDDIQEINFIQKRRISSNFLKKHHLNQDLPFSDHELPVTQSDYDQYAAVNFDDEEAEDVLEERFEKFEDLLEDNQDYTEDQSEDVDDEVSD